MNKMAVFVEGFTEQIFTEKLLVEIAGKNSIHIEKSEVSGKKGHRKKVFLTNIKSNKKYFAYIINCRCDSTVKSDIKENYESLVNAGYSSIIGIRDVYPISRYEIHKLRKGIDYSLKTKPIAPVIILSVMEIEAWFLAEYTHFQRIHEDITIECVRQNLGFDPSKDDMELRDHPAEDLHNIYAIGGKAYCKNRGHLSRTAGALDYAKIYLELSSKMSPVRDLVSEINRFMEQ